MIPRFVLGRENVPCVVEVVNRSLKADCTDFTFVQEGLTVIPTFDFFNLVVFFIEFNLLTLFLFITQ